MKMRNDDLKKITEIKQYLLDPPVSFKLYDYAIVYLQDALNVLSAYTKAEDTIVYLQHLLEQLQNKTVPQDELRGALKEAGKKISRLTSQ
jgi:chromosome condensin MukBEF ATPase and DNA-binding subunit MukB